MRNTIFKRIHSVLWLIMFLIINIALSSCASTDAKNAEEHLRNLKKPVLSGSELPGYELERSLMDKSDWDGRAHQYYDEMWTNKKQKSMIHYRIYVFNHEQDRQEYMDARIKIWNQDKSYRPQFGDQTWNHVIYENGEPVHLQVLFTEGNYTVHVTGAKPASMTSEKFKDFFEKKVRTIESKLKY